MRTRFTLLMILFSSLCSTSFGQEPLAGIKLWENRGDPARQMVEGIHRFLDREIAASASGRERLWNRDFSSIPAYQKSIESNRKDLIKIIGATAPRVSPVVVSFDRAFGDPEFVAESRGNFRVRSVRWSVYEGFDAEGLLLEPIDRDPIANVVYLPDADETPEIAAGIAIAQVNSKDHSVSKFGSTAIAARLAASGCRVVIPTLVGRSRDYKPPIDRNRHTNREWIYRQAFEAGRHLIGYEVDEVRAAVDWFKSVNPRVKAGVAGYGEGGLIAFYAAAIDPRIDSTWVRGYFSPRENMWKEPIDRNIWNFLTEFGDAEIASLVAPRRLVIEATTVPRVDGKIPGFGSPEYPTSGRLDTPTLDAVGGEFARAKTFFTSLSQSKSIALFETTDDAGTVEPLEVEKAIDSFLKGVDASRVPGGPAIAELTDGRHGFDPAARQARIVKNLTEITQAYLRTSELRRYEYWKKADKSSLENWSKSTEAYRERYWNEVIGKFPAATEPLSAETVRVLETPKWRGYAVKIPVWRDVDASGILLMPNDIKPGERRPVVVCQHGLEGRPEQIVDPTIDSVYHAYGARLADLGYIVYAPQNPYIFHDGFRSLVRKAQPLGKSLYSVIVRQHERTLEWLKTLAGVDPARIAFYGLSYGGKTAMRIPAILKDYCLTICSGDFNEWVVKCTNIDRTYSYLYTMEYDMYEFGLSEGYNYAEIAALVAPRPFMVERGHDDPVAPDEWIGYEFAKIRSLYDRLGITDRAAITYFNGGHMIKGEDTFKFLERNLGGPR